jgi:SAM-dependent methyltransferase
MVADWARRIGKAFTYINKGDWSGLKREIAQFRAWKSGKEHVALTRMELSEPARWSDEADFWAQFDADQGRRAGWGSITCFGPMALLEMSDHRSADLSPLIVDLMRTPSRRGLRGLVLGCGDMASEHTVFLNPALSFAEIDAYDVNEAAFDRARRTVEDVGLNVNLRVGDVNHLTLPENMYHLIVIFHSYHHFDRIDYVTQQINRALAPGGVFYTFDYVGAPRLQWTDRQLFFANLVLKSLPNDYRRDLRGQVRQEIQRVPSESLSPSEANYSDQILPAMAKYLDIKLQYNWAGLLYPLLEGIAFNFDENKLEDRALIDHFFHFDRVLCQTREIIPNFTITLATKKS